MEYRKLTELETELLINQGCRCDDWQAIGMTDDFSPDYVFDVLFIGEVRMDGFTGEVELDGGVRRHTGLCHATIDTCTIGRDVYIDGVRRFLSHYDIGARTVITDVGALYATVPGAAIGRGASIIQCGTLCNLQIAEGVCLRNVPELSDLSVAPFGAGEMSSEVQAAAAVTLPDVPVAEAPVAEAPVAEAPAAETPDEADRVVSAGPAPEERLVDLPEEMPKIAVAPAVEPEMPQEPAAETAERAAIDSTVVITVGNGGKNPIMPQKTRSAFSAKFTDGGIMLSSPTAGAATVQIFTALGHVETSIDVMLGAGQTWIPAASLSAGKYFVRVKQGRNVRNYTWEKK